jgi:hypothetical protein
VDAVLAPLGLTRCLMRCLAGQAALPHPLGLAALHARKIRAERAAVARVGPLRLDARAEPGRPACTAGLLREERTAGGSGARLQQQRTCVQEETCVPQGLPEGAVRAGCIGPARRHARARKQPPAG